MTLADFGSYVVVSVSAAEVAEWNERWPCSSLRGDWEFTFDMKDGHVWEVTGKGKGEGQEVVALSSDARAFLREQLGIR